MSQQFKFGDRVQDKALGLGECVVVSVSDDAVYVMNAHGDYNAVARPEHLELLPHPDTVRLDWLGTQKSINVTLNNYINLKLPNLRAATDTAMRAQQKGML